MYIEYAYLWHNGQERKQYATCTFQVCKIIHMKTISEKYFYIEVFYNIFCSWNKLFLWYDITKTATTCFCWIFLFALTNFFCVFLLSNEQIALLLWVVILCEFGVGAVI